MENKKLKKKKKKEESNKGLVGKMAIYK